jgi:acyl-CoA thioesterase
MGPGIIYDDPFLEAARYVLAMDTQGATILRRIGALEGTGQPDLQWGFANLDSMVHFHRWQGTDWLYIENRVITGSHGFVSVQTQAWSNGGDLLATIMSQVAFFPLRHGWSMLYASE